MEKSRRFENNLNEDFGITLLKFPHNGIEYQVRATEHSLERFKENGINIDVACGDIISLGKERLYYFYKAGQDVAIIDTKYKMTIIITFEKEQIRIRTIIPKDRVFIKTGTKVYNLKNGERSFERC